MTRKEQIEMQALMERSVSQEYAFIRGAKFADSLLWHAADGEYLPEIDREVIALQKIGRCVKVVFAHRPKQSYKAKSLATGEIKDYEVKTYGGWNLPDIAYWLDVELPNE